MTIKEQLIILRDVCPDIWKSFSTEGYYCPDEFELKNNHDEGCKKCWELALQEGD